MFRLTPAETRIAQGLLDDLSLPQLAEKLSVTENTIRTHVKSIYAKTGVNKRTALVRLLVAALCPGSESPEA
jgi:DNA-binding CsgD family transcriptional regulator